MTIPPVVAVVLAAVLATAACSSDRGGLPDAPRRRRAAPRR